MPSFTKALAAASAIGAASAFPHPRGPPGGSADGYGPLAARLGTYQAPGPTDSRGPCPALNTMANHGLIPHNGKDITSDQLLAAFPRAFGVDRSGFAIALINYGEVCAYINGRSCINTQTGVSTFTNLTILGEPFAFEHDHSYSRQDYKEGWAHGGITDNVYFNSTVFNTTLGVAKYQASNPPHAQTAGYQTFQEIQLYRQAYQNTNDAPGGFVQSVPTTLFETGYIFGVTFDRDENANQIGPNPMVRLDWWNFWFSEESFPTRLGWQPASTEHFDFDFITSVSEAILNSPVTSTPAGLPANALQTTFPFAGPLPPVDVNPVYALFQSAPYVAPTNPASILPESGRRRSAGPDVAAAPANVIAQAKQQAGTPPLAPNPYVKTYKTSQWQRIIDTRKIYNAKVEENIAKLLANN